MTSVVLFLALFLVTPSHAQEAPNLAFLSEYIRELGVNERMRALGEREVTAVDANSRFPQSSVVRPEFNRNLAHKFER